MVGAIRAEEANRILVGEDEFTLADQSPVFISQADAFRFLGFHVILLMMMSVMSSDWGCSPACCLTSSIILLDRDWELKVVWL